MRVKALRDGPGGKVQVFALVLFFFNWGSACACYFAILCVIYMLF